MQFERLLSGVCCFGLEFELKRDHIMIQKTYALPHMHEHHLKYHMHDRGKICCMAFYISTTVAAVAVKLKSVDPCRESCKF